MKRPSAVCPANCPDDAIGGRQYLGQASLYGARGDVTFFPFPPPPQPSPTRGEGGLFLPPPLWGRVGVGGELFALPHQGGGGLVSPSPLVGEGWGGGGIVPNSTVPSIASAVCGFFATPLLGEEKAGQRLFDMVVDTHVGTGQKAKAAMPFLVVLRHKDNLGRDGKI
jgi:hypothetical protein